MLKTFPNNPATLTAEFPRATKQGIEFVTLDNGKIRFYDWDTHSEGSMHFFSDVAEYKTDSGVKLSKLVVGDTNGYIGCYFDSNYSIPSATKNVFMVTYGTVGSNKDKV